MRILALVLLLACCAPTPSPWEKVGVRIVDGVPQLRDVEITLRRTECFGSCTAYSVKLTGDGTLTYTGMSCVKTKGEHTTSFDPQGLRPLLELCHELNLLGATHACHSRIIDNSHAHLGLRIGQRSATVEDQVCSMNFEGWFNDVSGDADWHATACKLEESIDTLAKIESWIGTYDERMAHIEEWR